MIYTNKQVDRFWSNVDIGKPRECWPWKRSKHTSGYGQVGIRIDGTPRVMKAHKVAWEMRNNRRLAPLSRARHTCGNKLCCNPRHVYIVTTIEQSQLTIEETYARGEKHGHAKLKERQALIIKYRLNALTTREIADAFSISRNAVWDIRNNKTWRHI